MQSIRWSVEYRLDISSNMDISSHETGGAVVLSGCGGSDRHKGNAARKPKQIQQGEPA